MTTRTMALDITDLLYEEGSLSLEQIAGRTGHLKKSLSSRLYELKKTGTVVYDEEKSVYYLSGGEDSPRPDFTNDTNGSAPRAAITAAREQHSPLSADQDEFERLLVDCDVRRARETITRTFFSGNVYDLSNLVAVLEDARGYVNPNQARLVLRYWARYIGADIGQVARMEEQLGRPAGGKDPDEDHFIQDLGWQVVKDKDGDWVPKPGGELNQREALKWAATNNAIRQSRGDDDGDDDESETRPKGRRGRTAPQEKEPTMLEIIKIYKELMPDTSNRDEEVRLLRDQLEQMRQTQEDNRFQQLESMMTQLASRDPFKDFLAMRAQLNELAPPAAPVITDGSPTVQLLKDQSDKMDKGINRLAGIVERVALRGHDEVEPEDRYTEEERETRAGAVVKRLEQGEESRVLREELFGRVQS